MRFLQRSDEEVRNPEAWLIAVAKRACQDIIRKRQRRRLEEVDTDPATVGDPAPEDAVLAASLVRELLSGLREKDARLLTKLYVGGWSFDQVARELNLTPGNVRVMALRARRRAAKALEEMGVGRSALGLAPGLPAVWERVRMQAAIVWRRVRGGRGRWSTSLPDLNSLAEPAMGNWPAALAIAGLLVFTMGQQHPAVNTSTLASVRSNGHTMSLEQPGPMASTFASASPVASSPTESQSAIAGILGDAGRPKANPQQEDAGFSSIVSSPAYASDRTIFASGTQVRGCPGTCPLLFKSGDGGASWQRLGSGAGGFAGGDIIIPAAYPLDPLLFAVGPAGLQRSSDGGATFRTVLPNVAHAAMEPGAPSGQGRIVLATTPVLIYNEATGLASAGPTLPPGTAAVSDVQFTADGQHVVIGGQRVDPVAPGQADAVVMVCSLTACPSGAVFPGVQPGRVFVSPTEATDRTLGIQLGSKVVLSRDDGVTFSELKSPDLGSVFALGLGPSFATGRVLVIAGRSRSHPTLSIVLESVDGGVTMTAVAGAGLPQRPIGAINLLPDGHWLMGLESSDLTGDFGIRCSMDSGRHWGHSC